MIIINYLKPFFFLLKTLALSNLTDGTLTGATTPGQSRHGINGNETVNIYFP